MEITQYEIDEREVAKQEITSQIEKMLEYDSMSVVNGIVALNLIKTFIKYMDEERDEDLPGIV